LFVSKLEKSLGIEVYATKSKGIGGIIKHCAEDFVVKEILVDGSQAEINQSVKRQALDSSFLRENNYLLCVLVKKNWDTFSAVKAIADQLGISTRQIHIAGLKDAKAITAQHIAIEGVSANDISNIHIKDIKVQALGYSSKKLSPYYLLGNNFNITIRAINLSESAAKKRITKTVKELENVGDIPNFFGHQRFGTIRPITHLVGKAIVNKNFKKAVMLFLAKPSLNEHPESRQARQTLLATHDFKQALKNFPRQLRYERLMLRHLAKKPDDYIGAFRKLPAKLRRFFPQAYQAYLFNKFLSERIRLGFPLNKAEVGDYVVHIERSGLPMLNTYKIVTMQTLNEIGSAINAGRLRIAIPLIGFRQMPFHGAQGEIEKKILEEEGISPENFKIDAMPEISSRGQLRTAVTPLNNFSLTTILQNSCNPSKFKATVNFMLHRGSYATILLREIMKSRNPIKAGF